MSELAMDRVVAVDRGEGRVWQTAVAWLALLPASSAGEIVYRAGLHREVPSWLGFASAGILALLYAIAHFAAPWRPLRGYFLALLAFALGGMATVEIAGRMIMEDRVARMFRDTALNLIPCAFLALSLLGSGLTRRNVFVARGDMRAPARTPWGVVSWGLLGPVITVVLAVGLAVQLVITLRPDVQLLGRALAALPLAVAFAALNAVQEEFRFRNVFLARLLPAVGTTHALLITSLLFGLEHWFGHPSGPSGVLLAGFAGYVWGRSMVDTGGSAWAWLIHGAQDVVIFSFLVAANG